MPTRLPKLMGAIMLILLMLSFLAATPASAQCVLLPGQGHCSAPPYAIPAEPVWATLNAVSQGNYPGGNLIFDVFVVNSDKPPEGNVTLINETLTAAALPPGFQTNSGIGLPVELAPGQAILSTIALQIPSNFTQSNFTASLAANALLFNGTVNIPLKLTGTLQVFVLGLPISSQTATSSGSQNTQTVQSGTVSTTLFAVGVAIPSIVVVVLLALLFRGRGRPKGGP
ncbi:MAG: hypothetical protein OK454_04175 [Thaumarchaeota archaeon]|nr:hypothetical protein [Nitrososphaerota archaeon]